jgi:transcriptional regulator with PAS, ATPase and Fis domain
LFDQAHGGTIFLDEIGDASLQTQAKILRVLQEGCFKRISGTRNVVVDVRLISATNKKLMELISQGSFRQDLIYRLNTITINLPPLRERRGDIRSWKSGREIVCLFT